MQPAARGGAPSLFGLAPGGVCPAALVTENAVRSYRTISPLPAKPTEAASGRYIFCGTFPEVAFAGRYPAPYLRGARTFLPTTKKGLKPSPLAYLRKPFIAVGRPSDHLTRPQDGDAAGLRQGRG